MRRTILAAGALLALHTLAVALSFAYRQLVFSAGGFFTHATDIADIPRVVLVGFIALGIVAVVAGVVLERLWSLFQRGA